MTPRHLVVVALLASAACADPVEPDPNGRVEPVARPAVVRGVYVNAQAAGSDAHLAELLTLVEGTSVNTFVVDVKERGEVSYASAVPLVAEVGSARDYIADLPTLLRLLREKGIYPIARIVCFLDAVLAAAKPEWAIRTTSGDLWLDPESGLPWVDPYSADVWAYNIALAQEALAAGFAEIQWDYVRFPDVNDSIRATMVFPAQSGRTSAEAIEEFVAASRAQLASFDAPITADVFGRVITVIGDDGIGQDWDRLVRVTDVLLPMVYPALWTPGYFGVPAGADPRGHRDHPPVASSLHAGQHGLRSRPDARPDAGGRGRGPRGVALLESGEPVPRGRVRLSRAAQCPVPRVTSFCTRQLTSSATQISSSDGHAMAWIHPNSPRLRPGWL
jgi:hypothetical protein